ncbi:MAG: ABC transporter permease [Bacteroidetes bacterium]|nr:MAG: ABC transporter permease [Bacteroidota bacterium]
MKNVVIAWRNLWRNRRRTIITSASVFFAVLFALFFRSLQLGSYDRMFRNAIESYTGYIQVQHQDFWDSKVVDNSFPYDPDIDLTILSDTNVVTTIPRFESFALASSGPQTKGVLVMGILPEREDYLSRITGRLVKYRLTPDAIQKIRQDPAIPEKTKELARIYRDEGFANTGRLQLDLGIPDDRAPEIMPLLESYTRFDNGTIEPGVPGAWTGEGLAEYLGLGIGDTIVLISQGYHATTAAGKYEIKGIVKLPLPEFDNKVVYLPLDICQQMYHADNNLTSLALHIKDHDDDAIQETLERLGGYLPEGQRLVDWKEMNAVLRSQLEADNYSGMIMIGILYLVIAFGVFGTVLMMTAERRREFGVLVAIGMQKFRLAWITTIEMLLIGLLGIAAGSAVAIPAILYGERHPLVFKGEFAKMWEDYGFEPMMVFQGIDGYFLWQMLIVAMMVLVATGYPLRKILGIKVVNALKA